jgi:hypothetical protein
MDAFCWKLESSERDTSDVARVDSSTNSQRHRKKLLYGDYYLNILANRQEYLIQHDYRSLYPNSYHMNWKSTNLYYMICVYTICMFKFCINAILSSAICIYFICIYTICFYTICVYTICIYTICIYTVCI